MLAQIKERDGKFEEALEVARMKEKELVKLSMQAKDAEEAIRETRKKLQDSEDFHAEKDERIE